MNLSDRLVSDNAIFRTYEYSLHNGVLSDIKALTKEEYVIIKEFENGGKTVDYSYGFYERSNVKDGVYLQDRVYLLIDDEISYVNLIDMEENKLVSHLIFKDFILGNSKEIYFNGTDEDLNLVYGIIGLDDSVTMNIVKNNFEILYIPPIKIACSY